MVSCQASSCYTEIRRPGPSQLPVLDFHLSSPAAIIRGLCQWLIFIAKNLPGWLRAKPTAVHYSIQTGGLT
ncbi:MAG TPA: hypothetical protein VK457_18725, partial [Chloroflexota bacterium]|nr:hypothetical protein [Chloroflexota bacterium]